LTPLAKIKTGLAILAAVDDLAQAAATSASLVHQALDLVGHELAGANVQAARVGLGALPALLTSGQSSRRGSVP
jgi:hypothetical protein